MRGWWQEVVGLVLPVDCAGCGRPRSALCERCGARLSWAGPRRVRPSPEPPGLPPVYATVPYADEVRAMLLAHKERGVLGLAGALGGAVARAVRAAHGDSGPVLLVPVPSARRAVGARGHDPVRRLALAAAAELRRTGTPARALPVLRQGRAVADQSGLSAGQRLRNLAGALEVAAGCGQLLASASASASASAPVVLVDDLLTTGASLAEAARAVRAESAQVSGAAVVAAPCSVFPRTAGTDAGAAPLRGAEGKTT